MKSKILIIAGLDPSGNAGLLRDLEIVHSFGLTPSSVITALTAQSRKKFISAQVVSKVHFNRQLEAVSPLSQYKAIKIGMLGNEEIVRTLVSFLKKERRKPLIVLDPVCQSTTGGILLTKKGRDVLFNQLLPIVDLWTPNLDEASYFSGLAVRSDSQMEKAAEILWKEIRRSVLIKGMFSGNKVKDLYFDGKERKWLVYPRVYTGGPPLDHWRTAPLRGTGCALSSFIACQIAQSYPMTSAARIARQKMQQWIQRRIVS